jgi:hypothetical protein
MKQLKATIGNFTVQVEGETAEELFSNMAEMAELLSCGKECGMTGGTDIIPVVRTNGDYTFFEWKCMSSGASLALGRRKDGHGFFPKRKDKATGDWLPNNGWVNWKDMQQQRSQESSDDFATNF